MWRWGKEVQGASFGGIPGEKRYRPSSRCLTVTCRSCTPIPKEEEPRVEVILMSWQSRTRVSCGVGLSHSSRSSHQAEGAQYSQVWLVWANKGALGNQELSMLLGCSSLPALLRAIPLLLLMILSPTGCELGGSVRAAPVTSHGSAPSAAGIGVPVMRLVVTVPWKQPLLKPQYLGHLI